MTLASRLPGPPRVPEGGHPALRGLPAAWLRDNCRCAECRHPGTGQRLFSVAALPAGLAVAEVSETGADVAVVFSPGGHRAVFSKDWLAGFGADGCPEDSQAEDRAEDDRAEDAKLLWSAADLAGGIPEGHWLRYLTEPGHRAACLAAVLRQGLLILRDVPARDGAVLAVAESFGYVRETNYGRLFDVRAEASPDNLAYTSLPIPPHTDNPYRDPVPTVQLLHCLHNAASGGDSAFADGFRAAALLRERDPAAFAVLAGTPVTFGYDDAGTRLRATRPLIGTDPRGRVREIRFNTRSLRPVRLAGPRAVAFYAAYQAFALLAGAPEAQVTTRLAAGDCVIFDNTRILHARTGFSQAGTGRSRHLQGCYADLDGLGSALAMAGRDYQATGRG